MVSDEFQIYSFSHLLRNCLLGLRENTLAHSRAPRCPEVWETLVERKERYVLGTDSVGVYGYDWPSNNNLPSVY